MNPCVEAAIGHRWVLHEVAEWSVYIFAFFVLVDTLRRGPQWTSTYLTGAFLGLALECFIVCSAGRSTAVDRHFYLYCTDHVLSLSDVWRHFATPPSWTDVPVWVALGWGIILYSCTWTAQRLHLPPMYRPLVAGSLAVSIDLSLDPIAHQLGFWHWFRTGTVEGDPFHFIGVPFDNFVAWFGIVALYAAIVRFLLHLAWRRFGRSWAWTFFAWVVPPAALLCELALYAFLYQWIDRLYAALSSGPSPGPGEGEAWVFFVLSGLGLLLLVRAMTRSRRNLKPNGIVLAVPFYFNLLCLLAFLSVGSVEDAPVLLAFLPMNLIFGVVLFAWPSLDAVFGVVDGGSLPPVRRALVRSLRPMTPGTLVAELFAYEAFQAGGAIEPPRTLLSTRLALSTLVRDTLAQPGSRIGLRSARGEPDLLVVADAMHRVLKEKGAAAVADGPHRRERLARLSDELVSAADLALRFRREGVWTYSGERHDIRRVAPRNLDELREALRYAASRGWDVTPRTGGHAFDTQSVGSPEVSLGVSLEHFDGIEVDPLTETVAAGAGATWGAVLDATLSHGLLPYVMVTSQFVSVGGSLSSHSLSRFSLCVGREGAHVLDFDVMLPTGEVRTCSRTAEVQIFEAVVGGLGHVGLVLRVRHRLARVPDGWGGVAVHTRFTRLSGLREIAQAFAKEVQQPGWGGVPDWKAVSAMVYLTGKDRSLFGVSRYVDAGKGQNRPVIFHQPGSLGHRFLQFLALFPVTRRLGYELVFLLRPPTAEHEDELRGYTFFEDGSVWIKETLRRLGVAVHLRQQSFLVPLDPDDPAFGLLRTFLGAADGQLDQHGLVPSLIDVVFLPPDDRPYLFSATRDMGGFLVSFTFEKILCRGFEREEGFLRKMARECTSLGGRLHLVKNVVGDRQDVLHGYRAQRLGLDALRATFPRRPGDPCPTLSSSFSKRLDPS